MLMADWMKESGTTPEDIVKAFRKRRLVVTVDMVKRVRDGRRRFSPEKTREVIRISGGAISWDEMFFPKEFRKAS